MPEINLPTKAGQDSIITTIGGVNTNVDTVKAKTETINTNVNTINSSVNAINSRTNNIDNNTSSILSKINNRTAASYFEASRLITTRYSISSSEFSARLLTISGKGRLCKLYNTYGGSYMDITVRLNNGSIYAISIPSGGTIELNWYFESALSISVASSGSLGYIAYEYHLM